MSHPEPALTTAGISSSPPPGTGGKLNWRHSLLGKVAVFMLLGVVFAYGVGAAAGLIMLERGSREQWRRQAEMNAQIASSTIRGIYTSVSVETDSSGQIVRLVTERPIGDEDSVLNTGFAPADVLALAGAQTRQNVWLFRFSGVDGFVAIADSLATARGSSLEYGEPEAMRPAALKDFFVGFARIGGEEHFVSSLPVVTPDGELLGAVVSSIGQTAELHRMRDSLVQNSLLALLAVLVATAVLVTALMRRLFRPVPVLIQALTRIAHNDTGAITPFRNRQDEIGRLAAAIETLREAVVEREHLRQVKEAAMHLEHMAHHDTLTGLPNRAFLNKALDKAMQLLPTGRQVNFMLFDLDRFKAVNDSFGHATGDALLVAVGNRITLLLGPEDIASRLGGDEFAIVQQVSRDAATEARRLAGRIVEEIGTPFAIEGRALSIGASVGIACAPADGNTSHDLLTNADVALYAAKDAGRGNFVFYRNGMTMRKGSARPGFSRRTGPSF
ncbi:sensor domain-containing diguanylate cyclase [Rhizobiaceae bacterium BDR2-2]|uniref:Sensor domain-containing diguanylate cyclase n=1 Tax=Ectorhizobium quercum TaxID=2965071 RepID=A0AAE3N0Q4_9HYPH|nr:sensor domain-containing diguanylate cyclase [Ectorhizobium quercum]MCX8997170.1 sensor domain-containing diguanylate cyclase [Ectorhizobium quercum]